MTAMRAFEERIAELRGFVARHGSAPRNYVGGPEASLARWLAAQSKRAHVSPEQEEALRATGVWPVPKKDNWETRFAELSEFCESHERLPAARTSTEASLSRWVTRQRQHLRDGSLLVDREDRLNRLAPDWAPIKSVEAWWHHNISILLGSEPADAASTQRAEEWLTAMRRAAATGMLDHRRTTCLILEGLLEPGADDLVALPSWVHLSD